MIYMSNFTIFRISDFVTTENHYSVMIINQDAKCLIDRWRQMNM